MTNEHPAPWWYRLAARIMPSRCREIPEAVNPDRVVLRQVAIWKRHCYVQQFAGSEDPRYMHSHQWHRTIALGLWGSYTENRMAGPAIVRRAPYCYTMGADVVHHVQNPGPGHTSVFVGLWRDDDLKHYYGTPSTLSEMACDKGWRPMTRRSRWERHIRKMVERI